MPDWDDLRLFLAVARTGGLAGAARETGKSAPTLGRRMLALERQIGSELFDRHPRGYTLTPAGTDLLAQITALESRITPLITPTGPRRTLVKISAGSWMTQILCAQAAQLSDDDIALRFIAADHMLDITHREAVIGIRNARPEQTGLAGRRVGRVHFAGYARPQAPRRWIPVLGTTPSARWIADQPDTLPITVTTPRNALDLALAGLGRAVLPTFIGDATPHLARVTPSIPALAHDQWLVTHHEDRFGSQVRRVIDRLARILATLHAA